MKNKNFLIPIFAIFLIIATSFFGWLIMAYKIHKKSGNITELRKIMADNERKILENKNINNILTAVKNDKAVLNSVFLTENDLLRVIQGLESISKSSGAEIEISSINMSGNSTRPIFNFSVSGSFEQLFDFFYFLENIPYLIIIDEVSFRKNEGENKNKWEANFQLELEGYEKS